MHAQTELAKHEGQPTASEEDHHAGNVKRGLTAYVYLGSIRGYRKLIELYSATHNPNVTDEGKQQARNKLEAMGEAPERPAD